MVGVPGRSKGCNTCRKRRVKCDEARPNCQRCAKAGFECSGYERERIWRNSSMVAVAELSSPIPHIENRIMTKVQPEAASGGVGSLSPPPELSLVAFRDNICLTWMLANHVWRSSGIIWLEHAASGKLGSLSLHATYALSQTDFGCANHQPDIERRGITLYGQTLSQLAAQLTNLHHGVQNLIVPIIVLMMYAVSHVQADRTGAIFHLRGLAKLLVLCGPEAFQHQPLLDAFEAGRAILLISSLIGKRRLFLEDEKWRTIPWLRNRAMKTPQSEVLDILIVVPGILQDLAASGSPSISDPNPYHEVLRKVEVQLILLYRWRWKWQARSSHQVSSELGSTPPPITVIGSSGRLRFHRFVLASEIMLYNATLMWLLALVFKMNLQGASRFIEVCATTASLYEDTVANTSFHPLLRPGAVATLRDLAIEILCTFDWVTRHHHHSKEPTYLYLFPVGVAMTALQDDPKSMDWAKLLLGVSPVTANYALGANQAGFGFYLTREAFETVQPLEAGHQDTEP
ncbi:hypothetical protein GQ44DRAFT_654167, partial [Phaeosphaeriaceae sp. PMI808]